MNIQRVREAIEVQQSLVATRYCDDELNYKVCAIGALMANLPDELEDAYYEAWHKWQERMK